VTRMAVRVDTDGFEAAIRRMREMRARALDVTPAWDTLLDWWADTNLTHFVSGGNRWDDGWAPLAARTLREKAATGHPLAALIRTGSLMEDLTRRPLGFESIGRSQVTAGTTHRAAVYHQRGTTRADGSVRMPRRRLVNTAQFRREGAATRAVRNWIIDGSTSTADLR